MSKSAQQIGRLAMRLEGDNWVAYYALPDTMDGALWLGAIKAAIVQGNAERKTIFMGLMREAVSDIIEEKTGVRPVWPVGPKPAPEHERAGRG